MQLIAREKNKTNKLPFLSGKTSPEYSVAKTTHLDAFWQDLPAKTASYNHQGENGRTLVVCMDPKGQSLGSSKTPNISAWPNDAQECCLSQALEETPIQPKYFLSEKACAGMIPRQDRRPCLFVSRRGARALSTIEKLTLLKVGAGFDI